MLKLSSVEKFGGSCRPKVTFFLAVRLWTEQSGTLYGAKEVLYTEQSDAMAHDDVDDDGCTDEGGDGVEGNFP